ALDRPGPRGHADPARVADPGDHRDPRRPRRPAPRAGLRLPGGAAMSFTVEIDVKGLEEAARRIRSVLHALESEDVEKVLVKGAEVVGRQVRANIRSMTKRHTGRLLSAVKISKGKRRGKLFATAFTAM